jgi:hypothetical protein
MTNPISFSTPTAAVSAVSTAPPSRTVDSPATPVDQSTTAAQGSSVTDSLPQRHQEVEIDKSGLTVVMTYDSPGGGLVDQYPTEAYLRLANAMQNVLKTETVAGAAKDRTA